MSNVFDFGNLDREGDLNFYTDSVDDFEMATSYMDLEEVGISFCGEVEVDDNIGVITDKQVPLKNKETTIKTYQKVMKMRELSEAEILHISKFRLVLKKLFDVFFNKQKFRVFFTLYCFGVLSFKIATEDYLTSIIYIVGIFLYTKPIKYAQEMKKIFGNKEKREELREELEDMNLMGLVNSIQDDEGIQLYFKPKGINL